MTLPRPKLSDYIFRAQREPFFFPEIPDETRHLGCALTISFLREEHRVLRRERRVNHSRIRFAIFVKYTTRDREKYYQTLRDAH